MTIEEFQTFMLSKSVGRFTTPDKENMTERVYTGLKHIARNTIVLRYCVQEELGHDILRRIGETTFIRYPQRPLPDSGIQLDIDPALLDALALYVMAGLELSRSKVLMGMYREEIELNNQRMIETYLEEATNDAPRFNVFP